MILTLQSPGGTVRIDITPDHFKRLRDPSIDTEEIGVIATACGCDKALLNAYAEDLKKSVQESIDIDGSCDYSDHL